jgi:2-dehydropantoate 2-reductase
MENVARITLTQNIEGAKWTKLICNTMTMGPISLTGLKNWDARKLPGMFGMSVALGRESMAVGKALGYALEPVFGMRAAEFSEAGDETLIAAMEALTAHVGKESLTAAIHDHIKHRRSEISHINGLVARKGAALEIPVPCNAAVTEIDRRLNEGEIEMDPANFGLLRSMVESLPNRV